MNTLLLFERDLIARRNHFTIQPGEAMAMMQPGGGEPPRGGKDVPDATGPGAPIQSFRNLNFEGY